MRHDQPYVRRRLVALSILAAATAGGFAVRVAQATPPLPHLQNRHPDLFSLDTTSQPGHTLLRYRSVIVNTGNAPFVLHGDRAAATDSLTVTQELPDGSRLLVEGASMFYAGDGHNHTHLDGLDVGELTSMNGTVARLSAKRGYCFFDNVNPGDGSLPVFTSSNSCAPNQPDALHVTMGLSPGWGDSYAPQLAFQYVSVDGLPPGRYTLHEHLNRGLRFAADTSHNAASVVLDIDPPNVTVVREGPGL